jgi:hypothetical protein
MYVDLFRKVVGVDGRDRVVRRIREKSLYCKLQEAKMKLDINIFQYFHYWFEIIIKAVCINQVGQISFVMEISGVRFLLRNNSSPSASIFYIFIR